MKKLNLFLFAQCMCITLLHAQVSQPEMVGLPNILPPTPEAFALGKFGNNPIGLFTGTIQYGVPLYSINTGSINLPLSISYSSNGVKIDEVASRVGLQWKMDFGGVVNRTVHGAPDEIAQSRTGSHDDTSQAFYNFVKLVGDAPTSWDPQPDEYNFSFPGYSGKFYFKNGQPVLIPVGNVQIQKVDSIFIITTPDSTRYHFGENLSYDDSRTISGPANCTSDAYSPGYITAWYLTRIVLRSGETVTYVYDAINGPATEITYPTGISQTYSFTPIAGTWGDVMDWNATPTDVCIVDNPLRTCYQTVAYTGAKLKEIQFTQGKVRLVYSSRDDVSGEKKLDSLIVENAEGAVMKKYHFTYSYSNYASTNYDALIPGYSSVQSVYPEIRKRLFLTKVLDCTISGDTTNKYLFEYDDYGALPPRLSFAQDYWGFFNGKANELFYPNYTYAHMFLNDFPSRGGDRTGSFSHSKKGMLKKITYPTGGSSTYTYETNTNGGYSLLKPTYDTVTFSGNLGKPPTPFTSSSFTLNNGKFHIVLESSAAVDPPTEFDPFQYDSLIHVKLTDNSSTVYFENTLPIRALYQFCQLNNNDANRQFQLLVESDYPNVYYTLHIYSEDPGAPAATFIDAAGVRVAEVYDEDGLGNVQNHRVFKYHKFETPSISSGTSVDFSMWDDQYYSAARTFGNTQFYNNIQCSYLQLQSNSQYSLYRNSMASVNYSYVIELLKDKSGTLTGGTEHRFQVDQQTRPIKFGTHEGTYVWDHAKTPVPGCPNSNTDLFNGLELETKVFTLSSPTTRTIRQFTKNYYSVDSRRVTIDTLYAIRKAKVREAYGSWKYFADFDINRYFIYSKWNHLDSSVATEYTASGDSLLTRTHYEYANSTHLMPTRVVTWDSKQDLRWTRRKYPGEIDTLAGPTYVTLTGKNTTEAVKEKFYKNSDFLFSRYTKYKNWSGSIVEPEYTEVADASTVMSKVEFHAYNTRGKLKEVSRLNGSHITYLWDTVYHYPLAEVMNASIADVSFTSFESNAQGTWSYNNSYVTNADHITGAKCFNLSSGSITRSSLSSSKEYIVSYWSTGGSYTVSGNVSVTTGKGLNGWTNYIHKVTGVTSLTISGTGYIDEVRLHPRGSLMKTYSYKLLTGLNAECDANNRITYYEYDAAGRLVVIRDQESNILKKFEYKYGSQQ